MTRLESSAWGHAARLFVLIPLAIALGACGGSSGGSPKGPALVSIEVTPTNPSIAAGTATGIYEDATHGDLTGSVTWASSDSSVVSVDDTEGDSGRVVAHLPGSAEITAELDSVMGQTSVTVTAAELVSIEVTPASPVIALGTGQQFTATGVFTDGSHQDLTDAVTWSSSDTSVADASNDSGTEGTVTSVATGSTTVTAAFDAIVGWTGLSVTPAVLVSIEVTPTNPTTALGTTQQLTATGVFSDRTNQDLTDSVTWESSDPSVATVGDAAGTPGLATGLAIGSTTMAAIQGAVRGETVLTVDAAALVSIGVTPTNPSLAMGVTRQLSATGVYTDASTQDLTDAVTWFSGDEAVVQVSNAAGTAGLVTSIATGSTAVRAALGLISDSTTVTVTAADLVSIGVTPASSSAPLGRTAQFTATGVYTDASTQDITTSVTWNSSDIGVASISNAGGSEGLATGVAAGSVTVTAAFGAVSGATTFTVDPPVLESIDITPIDPSIPLGLTQQLTATGIYSDASTLDLTSVVTWNSTTPVIASVSNAGGSEGLATSVATGSTTLTAALGSVSGSTTLAVTAAELVSIDVTPTNSSTPLGLTQQLTATGTYTDATTQDLTGSVAWLSTDTGVATVSNAAGSEGLATSVAMGSSTIIAGAGSVTGSTGLTITAATLDSIDVIPDGGSLALGYSVNMTATGNYSDGTTQDLTASATWMTQHTSIATVSNAAGSEGFLTSVAAGTTQVTATRGSVVGTTDLTVTAAVLESINVTPATPSIALGTTQQFTATGVYSDSSTQDLTAAVTWSSSATGVATVSNAAGTEGVATTMGQGNAVITATSGTVEGTADLTVTAATLVSIAVVPIDSSIALGTSQQFIATGTYSNSATQDLTTSVTWSSTDTGVVTISNAALSEGIATSIAIGMTTITATLGTLSDSTGIDVAIRTLASIEVTPADATLAQGGQQQYTAIGTFTDGATQDLTVSAQWKSSVNRVATVGGKGMARAHQEGSCLITATFSGIDGSATLIVEL